jgi:hypothetical protein
MIFFNLSLFNSIALNSSSLIFRFSSFHSLRKVLSRSDLCSNLISQFFLKFWSKSSQDISHAPPIYLTNLLNCLLPSSLQHFLRNL